MAKGIEYIANEQHFEKVIKKALNAKKHLWIGTADIKDLYVKTWKTSTPFLAELSKLLSKRVNVRLIHAKEPGTRFRNDFDKYPLLATDLERMLCPRVHFKVIIIDLKEVYIGSANLTGAGLGMKNEHKRNFESGILTTDTNLVENAINQFDNVWMGSHCRECQRKEYCKDCDHTMI